VMRQMRSQALSGSSVAMDFHYQGTARASMRSSRFWGLPRRDHS